MSGWGIREATERDLDGIVALLVDDGLGRGRERPGDPVYAQAFRRMTAQQGNRYLVAEDAGRIVGCLQLTLIHGLSRGGMTRAQIEGVRVAATHRGRGLGRQLFEAAFEAARAEGAGLVQLATDRSREGALEFYRSLGFTPSHWGCKRDL